MEYIYIGKIVNTHGIKGELRILSNFRYKEKVFKKDFILYLGKDKKREVINSYRPHKCFDMVTLVGFNNINEVLKYKGLNVYVDRCDLKLDSNEVLDSDLIDLDVFMAGEFKGVVKKVLIDKQDKLLIIKDNKEYYVPYVKEIIEDIDINRGITLKNIDGLLD